MKRAALTLGLLFWVVTSTFVSAQENQGPQNIVPLPIIIDCGSKEEIGKILLEYKEIPLAEGTATWKIPDGRFLQGPMTIWINPETFTYSITIEPTEETACIIMPGVNFQPYKSGIKA
jgi:hypothetical protein